MTSSANPQSFSARFFSPLFDALLAAPHARDCVAYPDRDHLYAGVSRVLSDFQSGRDLVQHLQMHEDSPISVDRFFSALSSSRRRLMVNETADILLEKTNQRGATSDPFAVHPELDGFALYATDGHSHGASAHEEPILGKKRAVTWIYGLNLRTHSICPVALCSPEIGKKKEHEIKTLKRLPAKHLRMGQPTGTKVLHAYDPAVIDYAFWHRLKQGSGVYMLTLEKSNSALEPLGDIEFDREDPRNIGVVADQWVGPAHGRMLRRITYLDPVSGKTYRFLTNESKLPPGLLAFIYKSRWDVEKLYDVFKNKFHETKAWGTNEDVKTQQVLFMAMAHNLIRILSEDLREEEGITDEISVKKKLKRNREDIQRTQTAGRTPNPMVLAMLRPTQITLQFLRWLRSCLWRNSSWEAALDALRPLALNYLR